MVVTHLFQVLGILAMEQPTSLTAKPLRNEINKVFESLRILDPVTVLRGQYEGYLDEPGVAPDSTTETFIALRAWVDNSRWMGVPFYLRTGKCLAQSRQIDHHRSARTGDGDLPRPEGAASTPTPTS